MNTQSLFAVAFALLLLPACADEISDEKEPLVIKLSGGEQQSKKREYVEGDFRSYIGLPKSSVEGAMIAFHYWQMPLNDSVPKKLRGIYAKDFKLNVLEPEKGDCKAEVKIRFNNSATVVLSLPYHSNIAEFDACSFFVEEINRRGLKANAEPILSEGEEIGETLESFQLEARP